MFASFLARFSHDLRPSTSTLRQHKPQTRSSLPADRRRRRLLAVDRRHQQDPRRIGGLQPSEGDLGRTPGNSTAIMAREGTASSPTSNAAEKMLHPTSIQEGAQSAAACC